MTSYFGVLVAVLAVTMAANASPTFPFFGAARPGPQPSNVQGAPEHTRPGHGQARPASPFHGVHFTERSAPKYSQQGHGPALPTWHHIPSIMHRVSSYLKHAAATTNNALKSAFGRANLAMHRALTWLHSVKDHVPPNKTVSYTFQEPDGTRGVVRISTLSQTNLPAPDCNKGHQKQVKKEQPHGKHDNGTVLNWDGSVLKRAGKHQFLRITEHLPNGKVRVTKVPLAAISKHLSHVAPGKVVPKVTGKTATDLTVILRVIPNKGEAGAKDTYISVPLSKLLQRYGHPAQKSASKAKGKALPKAKHSTTEKVPSTTEGAASTPAAAKPSTTEKVPSTTEGAASTPAADQPSTTEQAASTTEGAASTPAADQPSTTEQAASTTEGAASTTAAAQPSTTEQAAAQQV